LANDKRVYEIARKYDVSSEALLNILHELDFRVKSPMSLVNEYMLEAVEKRFSEEKEAVKREYKRKKKLIEARRSKEDARKAVKKRGRRKPGLWVGPRRERKATKKRRVDEAEVAQNVKRTLTQMAAKLPKRRRRHQEPGETTKEKLKEVRVSEFISVAELAEQMGVKPTDVISKCMEMGLLVTINERLDIETIEMVADEFGFQVKQLSEYGQYLLEEEKETFPIEEELRAPVVTIMGHVDHGKTSLLDYIRKSNIIAGESGGITQHIGAYEVELPGGKIVFLDTPGHEAFTAMRARGTQITDLVVLVVAADDGVKPQTVEAIDHARAAGVPIVVAINKMDLPKADSKRVKRELSELGLVVEEWGGRTTAVEISAKTGEGIDRLLEMLLFQAEFLELKANPKARSTGVVVESKLDLGRGPVATVLVQNGTLRLADPFVCGMNSGKVRALINERGRRLKEAPPSTPVKVLGLEGLPQAGDSFHVVSDERRAKEISLKRQQIQREETFRRTRKVTLADVYDYIKSGQIKELRIIIKGDVDGSVEALSDVLERLSTSEVEAAVIHRGVGTINTSDVLLAAASEAVVIGFHVRADLRATELAVKEGVDVRYYDVIYEVEEDLKAALEGLLEPEKLAVPIGSAVVRAIFQSSKFGVIAGSHVKEGVIRRGCKVRVKRGEELTFEGEISSLRRFKEDVKEVSSGFECGIKVEGLTDIREGDLLEAYEEKEAKRKL